MKLKTLCFALLGLWSIIGVDVVHGAVVGPALLLQYYFGKEDAKTSTNIDLAIPEEKKEEIRKLFAAHGFPEISLKNDFPGADNETTPNMSMNTAGTCPVLRMNSAARKVYNGQVTQPESEEPLRNPQSGRRPLYTLEEMEACVYHELGHAVHDHSKQRRPLPADLNIAISATGAVAVGYWLGHRFTEPYNQITSGFLSSALAFIWQLFIYDCVNNPFKQRQEREADQFLLDTGNKKLIQGHISFSEKMKALRSLSSSAKKFNSWISTHPLDEERIATGKKALAALEAQTSPDSSEIATPTK